ncbi:MAG: histidine ammonia-lyase, partial [Gammaproteobacteria bacterium]
ATQALEIRLHSQSLSAGQPGESIRITQKDVLALCPFVEEDRPLENELRGLCTGIQQRRWQLYK